jgi:hypothetical protein
LLGGIGVVDRDEAAWIVHSLSAQGVIEGGVGGAGFTGYLTAAGWERFEELKKARIASDFAFGSLITRS